MDVDRLSIDERTALMKEGRCFKCKQQGHMSRDCNQGTKPDDNETIDSEEEDGRNRNRQYIRPW